MTYNFRRCLTLSACILLLGAAQPLFGQPLPEGAESWYLWTSDDQPIYVLELGRTDSPRDTVVVLHGGWGAEHSYLVPAVKPLADQYHFVLYDQRGSFRSPVEDSNSVSLQRFVQDLEELRDELGIRKLTLLAHSRGPRLAWTYLRKHPGRVERLVFVSPEMPTGAGLPDSVEARNDSARQQDLKRVKRQAQEKLAELGLDEAPDSLSSRERTDRWRVRYAAANFHHADRWRQVQGGRMIMFEDAISDLMGENTNERLWDNEFEVLERSEVPIKALEGDDDFGSPVLWSEIAERLPNADFRILKNAGHNPWIDRPDAFRAWLEEAVASP